MLHAMTQLVERGPLEDAQKFFEVMRAMLFYIDEFPEQLHHPKESNLLFPKVVKRAPEVMSAIDRLERDHMHIEKALFCLRQNWHCTTKTGPHWMPLLSKTPTH